MLNHGIDVAQGQFIARMDADDIALNQRFKRQVAYLESHPDVAVCGTWCDLFGAENWQFRTPTDDAELRFSLVFGCVFVHPSVMWRRELFEQHRLRYDAALTATEDYDLWVRAARLVRFGAVPEVLLRYRKHERSATNLRALEGRAQYRRLQKLALQDNGYYVDEDTFEFHHRYSTVGLSSDDELPRLRQWLHWLWLSDSGASYRDVDAVGRVCARRWFDACAAASCSDKYIIFRSSALTSLLDRMVVERFAIDSGTVNFPQRKIP
jgi:glycosyltransferase involved in cell wall biosynthesis